MAVVDDEYSEDAGEDDDTDSDKHPTFALTTTALRGLRGLARRNNVVLDGDVALSELFVAEGVVDQATKCQAIAEELEGGDLGVPDDDGSNDKQNVLEDAGEGHYETGSLTDLQDRVRKLVYGRRTGKGEPTRKTLAMLRKNAIPALRRSMPKPVWTTSFQAKRGNSLTAATKKFMTAHTGA